MSATTPSRGVVWGTLAVCILTISLAAPLIVAAGAPAAVTSLWRMGFAGVTLFAWSIWKEPGAFRAMTRRDLLQVFVSGNLLALHYLFWIGSLSRTSVASSTVLVTTNPLWVGVGAWLFLREPPSRATWLAIVVGVVGAILLGLADASADVTGARPSLGGDAMALGGALAGSATLLFGRHLRARMPTALYQSTICLGAVPLIAVACAWSHASPIPVDTNQLLLLAAIVIVPQLIGNTILSWALGFLPAPRVALVILGEPIGASLLAWLFLHQTPKPLAIPGAFLVLFAVVQGARQPLRPAQNSGSDTTPT